VQALWQRVRALARAAAGDASRAPELARAFAEFLEACTPVCWTTFVGGEERR
jgi:hypothetical protein